MSLQKLRAHICLAIAGSLRDAITKQVPVFQRPSPIYLEKEIGGSLQLESIPAFLPAFYSDDGSFLIEPAGTNLILWPHAVQRQEWVKGSQVRILADRAASPDGTRTADIVSWIGGTGSTQIIKRSLKLQPGSAYCVSFYVRLRTDGGQFGANDVLRVVGDVATTVEGDSPEIGLNVLNEVPGLYQVIELVFATAGSFPVSHQIDSTESFQVTGVSSSTATLFMPSYAIAANDLINCQLAFDGGYTCRITANGASSAGEVLFTVDAVNLPAQGVTAGISEAVLIGPQMAEVDLEVYSESLAAIDWGLMDLKEGTFRTSPISQTNEQTLRSATTLYYLYNPFEGLKSFGILLDMRYWRGDGTFFDILDFYVWADEAGRLVVRFGTTDLVTPEPLPEAPTVYIQISSEYSSIAIYVDGILVARSSTSDPALEDSPFSLDSEGVRCYHKIIAFNTALTDGLVEVGQKAGGEVGQLFSQLDEVLSAGMISAQSSGILLPPVLIPGVPILAATAVTDLDTAAGTLTVEDATGLSNGATLFFSRSNSLRTRSKITGIAANVLSVESLAGVNIGDLAILADYDNPGRATVRLPLEADDPQVISAINDTDPDKLILSVTSVLSFEATTASVQTPEYEDIGLVQVLETNEIAQTITVTGPNVDRIEVGHVIFQPLAELLVDPQNYQVTILQAVPGVEVSRKAADSIELTSTNPADVTVNPLILANL